MLLDLITIPNTNIKPPAYISYNKYHQPLLKPSIDSVYFKSNKPFLDKINQFPDLKQHSIKGWEEYYCGPASLANGIYYLNENGCPNLIKTKNANETIKTLAKYLNTDKNGTTTNNLCAGIKAILKESGYNYKSITYQGFREINSEFSSGNSIPDLNWIKSKVEKKGIVLLNLGIYDKNNDTYNREYGHWVTVIGHGFDGKNNNQNALIIQDPYKKTKENSFITLEKLTKGTLIPSIDDNEKTLNNTAKGYYEITSQIPYLNKNEKAIINGVIALEL